MLLMLSRRPWESNIWKSGSDKKRKAVRGDDGTSALLDASPLLTRVHVPFPLCAPFQSRGQLEVHNVLMVKATLLGLFNGHSDDLHSLWDNLSTTQRLDLLIYTWDQLPPYFSLITFLFSSVFLGTIRLYTRDGVGDEV